MKNNPTHTLGFKIRSKVVFFAVEEIIRLEAESNYTFIHFAAHRPVLMAKVLREYEDLLRPFGFIRTHKSHLVNCHHIAEFDHKGIIRMADDSVAMLSRRKRKSVFGVLSELATTA